MSYDQWKTASPYDDIDPEPTNIDWGEVFPDYKNPMEVYHYTYKYTDCGPSIGFHILYIDDQDNGEGGPHNPGSREVEEWLYCDDLRKLPDWKELDEQEIYIDGISVSSIVEGVDEGVPAEYIDIDIYGGDSPEIISELFEAAIESVNKHADFIWKETHGCPDCFDYPEGELHPIDPDCKSCDGAGVIL